ncbi:MAG: alpha/beta hydrolase [Calothrix sp. MO_192.B10]|nr:alpha/beta hydrolase [Calothrix sp. MO_192.B10]
MAFKLKFGNFLAASSDKCLNLKFVARSLLLFLCASFFVLAPVQSAYAAKTVILEYGNTRTSIPYKQLENFSQTGKASDKLERFLQKIPLTAQGVSTLLLDESILEDEGVELNDKEIEFILIQVNKLVGSPLGREDIEPLAIALYEAYLNKNMSFIELAKRYPKSTVKINFKNLNTVYRDVKLFTEQWNKFLTLVFGPLRQELLCDCNNPTAQSKINDSQAILPVAENSINHSSTQLQIYPDNCSKQKPNGNLVLAPEIEQQRTIADTGVTSQAIVKTNKQILQNIARNQYNLAGNTPQIAQQVVFSFGLMQESLAISDLTSFAETGKIPKGWDTYFNLLKLKPEDFRAILRTESEVSMKFLDDILNNLIGEYILFQVGQVIHTSKNIANIQALRSALVLSAADDNKISILELLQNYPSQRVIVEGLNLVRTASNFEKKGIVKTCTARLEDILVELQEFEVKQICNCSKKESDSN